MGDGWPSFHIVGQVFRFCQAVDLSVWRGPTRLGAAEPEPEPGGLSLPTRLHAAGRLFAVTSARMPGTCDMPARMQPGDERSYGWESSAAGDAPTASRTGWLARGAVCQSVWRFNSGHPPSPVRKGFSAPRPRVRRQSGVSAARPARPRRGQSRSRGKRRPPGM